MHLNMKPKIKAYLVAISMFAVAALVCVLASLFGVKIESGKTCVLNQATMTTFSLISTIASLIIFAGFVALSVYKYKWQKSYSAYAAKWTEFIGDGTHAWSIVTIVVALFLTFGTVEAGDESPWQFLGFFAPVYLGVVALTPRYETDRKQKIIHYVGTILCAVCSVLWLVVTLRCWFYLPIAALLCGAAAYFTKTYKTSFVLWIELSLFAAVYGALLIGG